MLAGVLLVCAATAQLPHIGDINFYGLRKLTAEKILATLHLAPGDTVPASKGELEDRIGDIPGVVAVQIQTVCCEENRVAMFIGIEERGEPAPALHSPPSGPAALPADLLTTYREFLGAVLRAAGKGTADESLIEGHALMADPVVRGFQDRFITFAASQTDLLRSVLHSGSEPEERQAAATVIGYAPNKKAVVDDLLFAIQDPDDGVRSSAARSLSAIAVLAQKKPEMGIRISPTWFVELLNSVVLSDRVESTKALLILTDAGNAAALDLIREKAMPAVVEMARWKTLRYALPPFLLLGRIARLPDAQVHQSWEKGDREPVVQKALATAGKKRRG
jgi:hypothetical protein